MPEGFAPFAMPDSLEPQDLAFPFVIGGGSGPDGMAVFGEWIAYALVGKDFMPSVVMRASINRDITDEEIMAYDAPFPTRLHMAGPRTFPSLVNTVGEAPTNEVARAALDAFERPVLGMFGLRDPIFGDPATRDATRVQIAGAAGQPQPRFPPGWTLHPRRRRRRARRRHSVVDQGHTPSSASAPGPGTTF